MALQWRNNFRNSWMMCWHPPWQSRKYKTCPHHRWEQQCAIQGDDVLTLVLKKLKNTNLLPTTVGARKCHSRQRVVDTSAKNIANTNLLLTNGVNKEKQSEATNTSLLALTVTPRRVKTARLDRRAASWFRKSHPRLNRKSPLAACPLARTNNLCREPPCRHTCMRPLGVQMGRQTQATTSHTNIPPTFSPELPCCIIKGASRILKLDTNNKIQPWTPPGNNQNATPQGRNCASPTAMPLDF